MEGIGMERVESSNIGEYNEKQRLNNQGANSC